MMQLVKERALERGDYNLIFTQQQLDQMSNTMLRRLAAAADTDEINGKSVKLQIQSYLRCQASLSDYVND
jgi:hypothetical protein